MTLLGDLKTLYAMVLAPVHGHSHAARLESFYGRQAADYDAFRARLLHGRQELWSRLPVPDGGYWVDMGGGTGSNLEFLGEQIRRLARCYVVDLTPALLRVAAERSHAHGWTNVETVEADVTTFTPPCGPVDVITFSYALTMIPDWFVALERAWQLLRPGGTIGVVDFYVSRKYPSAGWVRHAWRTRLFWSLWFGVDNVFVSPDHVPYLHWRFPPKYFAEHQGTMPYLPGVRAPYYLFIGSKPPHTAEAEHQGCLI